MTIELSNGDSDFADILALQRANLRAYVSAEDGARNGFVTVKHTRELLERMHALGPSVVARSGGQVVGYALTMTQACRALLAVLEPMFARLDELTYEGRPLTEWSFYVLAQICIAEGQRGSGLFDALYAAHREHYGARFSLLVAEISARNGRSLRAHARVGFQELARYRDDTDDWVVVALDLRNEPGPAGA
jgi:L-amino acid N-acyltransferase YncA